MSSFGLIVTLSLKLSLRIINFKYVSGSQIVPCYTESMKFNILPLHMGSIKLSWCRKFQSPDQNSNSLKRPRRATFCIIIRQSSRIFLCKQSTTKGNYGYPVFIVLQTVKQLINLEHSSHGLQQRLRGSGCSHSVEGPKVLELFHRR